MREFLVLYVAACSSPASSPIAGPDASTSAPRCTGKAMPAHDATWMIDYGGQTRKADVHLPAGYDPTLPTAIVFNFHGFTSDGAQEALLSQMNAKADAAGFVVIYPYGTGTPLSWNAGACCGQAVQDQVDDIGFVRALADLADQKLCVDDDRLFATGMSNGGFLSHRIGCELADRFAAVAPVAGVNGMASCTPARAMPVMHFHGTADPLVPYNGSAQLGFISVPDSFAMWAARDQCSGAPAQTYQNGDSTCMTYAPCAGGAEVTLCTVTGGGHTWPGGTPVPTLGATTTDLSATDAMWTFFQAHPLRVR